MYHCLVILTDGVIHDLRDTVDKVVECTSHPISIIIVGIGDADFTAMETLDSDEFVLVNSQNQKARRDICQFVELSEFKEEMPDGTVVTHIDKLAEKVLEEVPDQLCGFMKERNLKPGDKPGAPKNEKDAGAATEGKQNSDGDDEEVKIEEPI